MSTNDDSDPEIVLRNMDRDTAESLIDDLEEIGVKTEIVTYDP